VAVYLNDILPGICVRRFHISCQHLIDNLSAIGVNDVSIDEAAVRKLFGEQPLGNSQGVLPAQPHDTDAALADGGGYRNDGILIHSLILVNDTSFDEAGQGKVSSPNFLIYQMKEDILEAVRGELVEP
jgi:hypothetical protein